MKLAIRKTPAEYFQKTEHAVKHAYSGLDHVGPDIGKHFSTPCQLSSGCFTRLSRQWAICSIKRKRPPTEAASRCTVAANWWKRTPRLHSLLRQPPERWNV